MIAAGAQGERTIDADQFFTGIMTTALADGEILVAIDVPVAGRGQGSAYEKFAHPASRYAVVGAAALVTIQNGTCSAARVALGGLLPNARRAPAVERALIGKPVERRDDCGGGAAGGRRPRRRRHRRSLRLRRVPRGDGAGLRQAGAETAVARAKPGS